MVAEGPPNDVRALFVGLYARGQRRDDLEREYLTTYHPLDERVPRFRQLPARRLVHITDLYTAEELKTSRTYNELLPRAGMQDSLNVQLPGLAGSHIGWGLNDPVDAEGWGSSRITMVERLLPHIQQFVRVRQVLAGAGALGASLADLLATTGLGIIQVDGRGRIAAANDRALALLRTGDGLVDQDGVLCADVPADDAVLQGLLTRALPPFAGQGAGGSMTVRRAADLQPLVVHLMPIGRSEPAVCTWAGAAVVVVVDPARRPQLDPALVAASLGLTPTESRVAVLLTEGKSLREVAAANGVQGDHDSVAPAADLRQAQHRPAGGAGAAGAVAGGRGVRPTVSPAGSCLAVLQEFSSTPSIWWALTTRSVCNIHIWVFRPEPFTTARRADKR